VGYHGATRVATSGAPIGQEHHRYGPPVHMPSQPQDSHDSSRLISIGDYKPSSAHLPRCLTLYMVRKLGSPAAFVLRHKWIARDILYYVMARIPSYFPVLGVQP
jgi:hypothetical protein